MNYDGVFFQDDFDGLMYIKPSFDFSLFLNINLDEFLSA